MWRASSMKVMGEDAIKELLQVLELIDIKKA